MWKRLLVVSAVSAAMSSMALAAPLTVGFSQVGSESGWRAAETNVAKSEAEKRGITLKIADGQQKQENQIKAVRSFVAQGVDAIFIAPVSHLHRLRRSFSERQPDGNGSQNPAAAGTESGPVRQPGHRPETGCG